MLMTILFWHEFIHLSRFISVKWSLCATRNPSHIEKQFFFVVYSVSESRSDLKQHHTWEHTEAMLPKNLILKTNNRQNGEILWKFYREYFNFLHWKAADEQPACKSEVSVYEHTNMLKFHSQQLNYQLHLRMNKE